MSRPRPQPSGCRRLPADDRGEMLLVMVALTAMLLGTAGALVWLLGRPLSFVPVEVNRDATLAAAGEWRAQALAAGLTAEQAIAGDGLDVAKICAAATSSAADTGVSVADCWFDTGGLTVVLVSGETSTAILTDASTNCLTVQTSWQETLPARCPDQADFQG
jgi:hypothetical protein